MDADFENVLKKLDNFPEKKKEMKDFDAFMAKVDEIGSIVKGFSSQDQSEVDECLKKADNYLAKLEGSDNEIVEGERKKTKSTKKVFNKTVINEKAFKDEKKKNEMDPDEFMKSIEEDAYRRAEDRRKRKEKAEEIKLKAEKEFNSGNYPAALELYNQAISTLKDWAALYTGRAQTHLQLGNTKEAMIDCDWAFRADEKSLNAHVTQGKVYVATGEHQKAIDIYEKALKLKPGKKIIIEGYINEAKLAAVSTSRRSES